MKASLRDRVEASGTKVEVAIHQSQSPRDRIWILTINTCPYCGKSHEHGGGGVDEPPALGHRLSHCLNRSASYELIPIPIKEEVET